MDGDVVYRLVVPEGEWPRLQRRKVMRGQQWATIPQLGGVRVVYNTAGLGERMAGNLRSAIVSDLEAMPPERRTSMAKPWLAVIADLHAEQVAEREPWECLGRVTRSLEQVVIVAMDLDVLVGRTADMVIVERMDAATEVRFNALIGLQRGRHRRAAAA